MRKPTIYELAAMNRAAGGKFFSRENLKFAGQTLRDFRVERVEEPGISGVFFVSAPRRYRGLMGSTEAVISTRTGRTHTGASVEMAGQFLEAHRAAPPSKWEDAPVAPDRLTRDAAK